MKKTTTIIMLTALACCLLSGCKLKTYYQLYTLQKENGDDLDIEKVNDAEFLVNKNKDCTVSYNFYGETGNGGFWFYNNTDSVIYIHLSETFFILNGNAYDYYLSRRRTHTTSTTRQEQTEDVKRKKKNKGSTTTTEGSSSSSSEAEARDEKQVIIVPPHATKHIFEYNINSEKFDVCNLDDTPGKKLKSQNFSPDNTPLTFGNYITYTVGNDKKKHIDDRFYIAAVSNVNAKSWYQPMITKVCGKNGPKVKKPKFEKPNGFYVTYKK